MIKTKQILEDQVEDVFFVLIAFDSQNTPALIRWHRPHQASVNVLAKFSTSRPRDLLPLLLLSP